MQYNIYNVDMLNLVAQNSISDCKINFVILTLAIFFDQSKGNNYD